MMRWLIEHVPGGAKIDWLRLWVHVGWIDMVFAVVFAVGVFIGLNKGFGKMLCRVIGILLAQAAVMEYYKFFALLVQGRVPALPLAVIEIAIFAALGIGVVLAAQFVFQVLSLIGTVEFKPIIKSVGGALLGGAYVTLALGLLTYFILLIPFPSIQESIQKGSISGVFLSSLSPWVHSWADPFIPPAWQAK